MGQAELFTEDQATGRRAGAPFGFDHAIGSVLGCTFGLCAQDAGT